jgi:hypothetical protein
LLQAAPGQALWLLLLLQGQMLIWLLLILLLLNPSVARPRASFYASLCPSASFYVSLLGKKAHKNRKKS